MQQQNRASGHFAMAPPVAQDPKLAEMEAEMKRLELEQQMQNKQMAEEAARLEAEAKALEAAMLASQQQMAQLQSGIEDGNSDEGDDDGSVSANANLLALTGAGFNPNAFAFQ